MNARFTRAKIKGQFRVKLAFYFWRRRFGLALLMLRQLLFRRELSRGKLRVSDKGGMQPCKSFTQSKWQWELCRGAANPMAVPRRVGRHGTDGNGNERCPKNNMVDI
ncbi:hypothetical protein LP415_01555 [Polaromonas sp. P1(28)-8]|nr:hypothetical protein LP415_01555 [Polaromonas sp. P1(28)-8]